MARRSSSSSSDLSDAFARRQRRRLRERRDALELESVRAAHTGRNDLSGRLRLEDRALDDLILPKRALLKRDEKRIAQAVKLAAHSGWLPPLLVSEAGEVIGDPLPLETARAMELAELACVVVSGDLGKAQIKLITTALAQQAASARFDLEVLRENLIEIEGAGLDISLTGLEIGQVDLALDLKHADPALDKSPEPSGPVVSRLGDLWLLGEHRLLCGDATDPEAYQRLMAGKLAVAGIGDPPYNVPIAGNVSGNGKIKHDDFIMGVGEWTETEFQAFLTNYLTASAAHVVEGGALFAFMDWRSVHLLVIAGKSAGLSHVNTCMWSKGSGAFGTPWRSAHEFIPVFANGPKLVLDNVALGRHGRNRTNVFEYPGANQRGGSASKALALHSTPKSVEMIADMMLDVTAPGDIVLDPFLGSGTTIIAADAVGRVGHGLDLDPKYVDVITRRWEALGHGPARHADTGATFAEVSEARLINHDMGGANEDDDTGSQPVP